MDWVDEIELYYHDLDPPHDVEVVHRLIDGLRLANMRVRTLIETSERTDLPDDYARSAMRRGLLDLKDRLDSGEVEP